LSFILAWLPVTVFASVNTADLTGADTDSAVPEPTSLMLLGLELLGLLDRGRRVSA